MTPLAKLSPLAKRERIGHARSLAAPMTAIPMRGDAHMMQIATLKGGRAMLERRAIQFGGWIAATERPDLDLARFNAAYDGAGRVTFFDFGRNGGNFVVDIPPHVLAFDPTARALALPAPEADPIPAPRCEHTAPLALDAPAPQAPEAAPASTAPMQPKLAKAATRPRKATQSAMREWAENRAMRAARIAKLPETTRRAIGARP